MSQRTCCAPPGAATAKVASRSSVALSAATAPNTSRRERGRIFAPLFELMDADLTVQDMFCWQGKKERREKRQLQSADAGASLRHHHMERSRGLALVAGLQHADAVEARGAAGDDGAGHAASDGHERKTGDAPAMRQLKSPCTDPSVDRVRPRPNCENGCSPSTVRVPPPFTTVGLAAAAAGASAHVSASPCEYAKDSPSSSPPFECRAFELETRPPFGRLAPRPHFSSRRRRTPEWRGIPLSGAICA